MIVGSHDRSIGFISLSLPRQIWREPIGVVCGQAWKYTVVRRLVVAIQVSLFTALHYTDCANMEVLNHAACRNKVSLVSRRTRHAGTTVQVAGGIAYSCIAKTSYAFTAGAASRHALISAPRNQPQLQSRCR